MSELTSCSTELSLGKVPALPGLQASISSRPRRQLQATLACRGAIQVKGPDTRAALRPRQTTAWNRWAGVLGHLLQGSASARQLGGILVRLCAWTCCVALRQPSLA